MANTRLVPHGGEHSSFLANLRDHGDGPGGTPEVDARFLASIMGKHEQKIEFELVCDLVVGVNTHTDVTKVLDTSASPNVTKDLRHTDTLEIDCGFEPKLVIVFIEKDTTTSEIYIKAWGMGLAAIKDFCIKGVLGATPTWTFENSLIRLNNIAETNANYITIHPGALADDKRHKVQVFG